MIWLASALQLAVIFLKVKAPRNVGLESNAAASESILVPDVANAVAVNGLSSTENVAHLDNYLVGLSFRAIDVHSWP